MVVKPLSGGLWEVKISLLGKIRAGLKPSHQPEKNHASTGHDGHGI